MNKLPSAVTLSTAPPSTELAWKLLSTKLRSFIRARVSHDHVADDLLQEVFLRIHQNVTRLRDEQRLSAWVFQIARNLIADYYRQRMRDEPEPMSTDVAGHTEPRVNEEISAWLPMAINQLPDKHREAVRLYELDGLEQREIAERLGVSLSGAKSRIQRGRAMLKSTLESCCVFHFDCRGNILDYDALRADEKHPCCGENGSCGD